MSTPVAGSALHARRERRRHGPTRGDQQERAILDAAERLLETHRFEQLTVSTVAEVAQISRPGVYFYFGSMEELLVALVRRGLSQLIESLESVPIPTEATPVEVLEVGLRRTHEGWRSHGAVLRTAIEHAHRVPGVQEQWRVVVARGVDLYVALMRWAAALDGRPEPDDAAARRQAELCMLMVGHAFHDRHRVGSSTVDGDLLEQDLLRLVARALQLETSTERPPDP